MSRLQEEKTNTDSQNEERTQSRVREIFLNILIISFLILVYYYCSVSFGSISTNYIDNEAISFSFNVTLFIFAFLAVLAGPIQAFIGGFIGELLYQLAFYEILYIEWIISIPLFGLACAIYGYKPLRFHEGKKVYYNFLTLLISSLIAMGVLIMSGTLLPISRIYSSTTLLYMGINFLLQSLLSVIFIVPLLLVLYDKLLANKERHIYNLFLTHHPLSQSDHTFYLKFGKTYVYFCTRCSGFILGALFTTFVSDLLVSIYGLEITPEIAVIICIILPIPGLIDWGLQRLLIRKANTRSRLLTGFIIGIALHMLSYTQKYYFFMLGIVIAYFMIFGLLMFWGHRREMKKFREEMEKSEYYTQNSINEEMRPQEKSNEEH
ncbi:MAG: DUF2085 domain-containing protein [Promethearchaeia archaeon]